MLVLIFATALAAASDSFTPNFADSAPRFLADDGGSLVLQHTEVHAEVSAGLAVVDVRQEFHNPYDHPINATYLFPLPPDAGVRKMAMRCGARRIEGQILDREEARERYERAAAEGKKAALLEQQRPNLFQQSIASLCPGEDVVVELQYIDPLVEEDGHYTLVFPTTMGPRYKPGRVPEPPFTTLPTHSVDVEVIIDEGLPVGSVWSDSHEITVGDGEDGRVDIYNLEGDDLPNKDFQLSWSLAGVQPQVSALALPPVGTEDGYLALTIEPALLDNKTEFQARELLFVLDSSCSMSGEPWLAEVDTIQTAMRQMRPTDTFDIVRFSQTPTVLFERPVPNTPQNVHIAESWLKTGFDGQGTEMEKGIVRTLNLPRDPDRLRLVLLLTDGYIGNEEQILASVQQNLGAARLFSLGVGSSVNHNLLDGLAEVGRGDVSYQLPGTPISETVRAFYQRIDHPVWTDLEIDWGGLAVDEVYPSKLPDLFAGQPLRVVARWRGPAPDTEIRLRGQTPRGPAVLSGRLDLEQAGTHEALSTLWARRKIADLSRNLSEGVRTEQRIAAVAKAHHLVSAFTSLVAVETQKSACGPGQGTVEVPSMVPEGVDAASVGGLGAFGTRGRGSGASGYGSGGGSFGAKTLGGMRSIGGDPIILGSLDKSLIEATIKRNLNQIRYCYQRELQRAPSLAGKVVMKFTVQPDGTVSDVSVKSSSLANTTVEDCLVQRFLKFQFPTPGHGVVIVSYPFLFSPK